MVSSQQPKRGFDLTHPAALPQPHPTPGCDFHLQVTNVDDEGHELGSGVMELTQRELILHTHKRDAVRWPYLCLRRYGFDSNLFSFESGRRCHTGQGQCLGGSLGAEMLRFLSPKAADPRVSPNSRCRASPRPLPPWCLCARGDDLG